MQNLKYVLVVITIIYTFFKDLLTVATDIEGGYITSIGNKRPLSALDQFYMSLTGFAFERMEPIKFIKNKRDGVGGSFFNYIKKRN